MIPRWAACNSIPGFCLPRNPGRTFFTWHSGRVGLSKGVAFPQAPPGAPANALKWLLSLVGLALLATQAVTWAKMPFDVLRFGALCSVVLLFLLWGKRRALVLESGPVSTLAGLVLAGFVLWKNLSRPGILFASFSPLLSGLGIALLASGFNGLRQYRQEFAILFFMLLPFLLRLLAFDIIALDVSPETAVAATGIVHLFGWQASARDVYVATPGGMVAVYEGCSGIRSMFFLFGLALLFLVLFPPPERLPRLVALPAAVAIAFVVNAFRVALLIILVSESRHEAFEYWHLGGGALLFESASVVIFIFLYRFLLLNWKPRPPAAAGDSHPNAALG